MKVEGNGEILGENNPIIHVESPKDSSGRERAGMPGSEAMEARVGKAGRPVAHEKVGRVQVGKLKLS